MLTVKMITVGTLKEKYLRDAADEYIKRLSAFCKFEEVNIRESRLPENPSKIEIDSALSAEAKSIASAISPKAYKIALCVEGKQFSSENLAKKISDISMQHGEICLIIGSSHGINDSLKNSCDLKLSVSELTFPHQLMRVILLETMYRSFNIIKGTKYHK